MNVCFRFTFWLCLGKWQGLCLGKWQGLCLGKWLWLILAFGLAVLVTGYGIVAGFESLPICPA